MRSLLLLLCVLASVRQLAGQRPWALTFEATRGAYSPAARDTSTPPAIIEAWSPTQFTFRLERSGRNHGVAIAISYMHAPLGGSIEDVTLLVRNQIEMIEIAPEWRYRLILAQRGARLVTHIGPIADGWGPNLEPIRWRIGGMAGLTLAFPLTERWEVGIRSDFAITGSYLRPEDDDDQIDVEPTMRRTRIGLGITRRV
jgi:hypothetical protein